MKTITSITRFFTAFPLLLFFLTPLSGQQTLIDQLQGKDTLWQIMDVVDRYYEPLSPMNNSEFESDWIHWKRWEWYMSGRLGRNGEFVNNSELLLAGIREKEKMESRNERNINSGWTFMGPSTSPLHNPNELYNGIGRVDRIAFHPTDQNTIYIGTPAGGLWRTTNGGTAWTNLTDNIPSLGISGIVVSYANANHIYILTGDGDSNISGFVENFGYMRPSIGVLKSTDGGASWHQTGDFPGVIGTFVGFRLVQSPDDPAILLAATSDGLYRTTNGGNTWVQERAGRHFDVEFKPGDGTRAYASVLGDIWISTNSGDTWTSTSTYDINPNLCGGSGGRIEIGVAPTFPSKVYFISGPVTSTGVFCGLWLSTDNGATFTRQSNTPNILGNDDNGNDNSDQSGYDLAIAARTSLSTNIAIAGTTVWKSTDGGINWTHCTSYNENGNFPYIHPDIHDVAFNPLNHWLYVASDGGFYRSQDFGATWTDLSPNIETSQFYHMQGWDGNLNKLMGGLQDNGVKYRISNNSAWFHIDGADGFDVVFNPVNGEPGYSTVNRSVVKYSADGASSTGVTPPNYNQFFKTIAIHNTDPDILLVGASDILRTIDGGSNYTVEGAAGSWSITSCPSNSTRFYAAGGNAYSNGTGSLYFSDDTGQSWTAKSGNAGFPPSGDWVKITDVTVRPNNSSYVWACFGGFSEGVKVVRSTNTGDTWTDVSDNLPNVPVNCLAIDGLNGAYAGTDIGVFYRSASMTEWMPWSNGLPNTPVTDLYIYDDGTTKRLRAATFGRGVWQSNLAETCDPSIIVSGNLEGIRHYEASTSISSAADVEGGIGTFVSFQSGNYVDLTEGFEVIQNSEFLGFISPCGQGGIPSLDGDDTTERGNTNSSIILLRRMWDKKDGLPYGSVDLIDRKEASARIKIRLKDSGHVELVAAKEIQEKLATLYVGELESGIHELDVDLSSLSPGLHYLILFYNGKVAHYQELELH
jgi:photosystem II stability/assembly factor-like uncharacterized protein